MFESRDTGSVDTLRRCPALELSSSLETTQSVLQISGGYQHKRLAAVQLQLFVSVDIDIAPGWHVNAHKPLQDNLIATVLTSADGVALSDISYPEPLVRTLGFQSAELALYEESATIVATLPSVEGGRAIAPLVLRVQACSDEVCLAPETIELNLSTAAES